MKYVRTFALRPRSAVQYTIFGRFLFMNYTCWRGPALGGVCLGIRTDFSQTRVATRLPTRRSVHVVKALRSTLEIAIALGTTKSFFKFDDVVDLRVRKGGDILPFREHADRAG